MSGALLLEQHYDHRTRTCGARRRASGEFAAIGQAQDIANPEPGSRPRPAVMIGAQAVARERNAILYVGAPTLRLSVPGSQAAQGSEAC